MVRRLIIPAILPLLMGISSTPASSHGFRILYSFCSQNGCPDGYSPGPLAQDASGDLYGATSGGGANGTGTIFELKPVSGGTYAFSNLFSLCNAHGCGAFPVGSLVIDKSGDLYGAMSTGGAHYVGQLFELIPGGHPTQWTYQDIYDFCSVSKECPDGGNPYSGLTYAGAAYGMLYDGKSSLFGTASEGGTSNDGGVVYELTPAGSGWIEQPIYQFCAQDPCSDGNRPYAPVSVDGAGNLYGTTYFGGIGGVYGAGVVFELSPGGSSWSENVLHQFCSAHDCTDGLAPLGGVTEDTKGTLFGVTPSGGNSCNINGNNSCGIAYRLAPKGTDYMSKTLHVFCSAPKCADGALPEFAPVVAPDGLVFGTTLTEGSTKNIDDGAGTLFELNRSKLSILHTFCKKANCVDGNSPNNLIRDSHGNLFGSAGGGGAYNRGIIFEYAP